MSKSFDLLSLQEIDDEAAALRASSDGVAARLKGNAALDDARRELQYLEEEIKKRRARQRRIETEIDDLNAKIEPEEKRLYDGSITSPKELQSLQKELDFLTGNRSQLEERLLGQLSQIEELEPRRRTVAGRIETLEREWETTQSSLRQESRQLEDKLAKVEKRRAEQRSDVPPRTLALYDSLRERKGGVAVAPIKAGACSSCRVTLPGNLKSKTVDKDSIVQCPNCERILTLG